MSKRPKFTLEVIEGIQYMEQSSSDPVGIINKLFLYALARQMVLTGEVASVEAKQSDQVSEENALNVFINALVSEGILIEQDRQEATENQPEKATLAFSSTEFAVGLLFAFFRSEFTEAPTAFDSNQITKTDVELLANVFDPDKLQAFFNLIPNSSDQSDSDSNEDPIH